MADTPRRYRTISVLWSAFMMAAVLEMVVFALVDPQSLHWFGGDALQLGPRAVYSLAFLLFWVVIAVGGALSLLLSSGADELNDNAHGDVQRR